MSSRLGHVGYQTGGWNLLLLCFFSLCVFVGAAESVSLLGGNGRETPPAMYRFSHDDKFPTSCHLSFQRQNMHSGSWRCAQHEHCRCLSLGDLLAREEASQTFYS